MLCAAEGGPVFPGVPQPCLGLGAHCLSDVEDTFCLVISVFQTLPPPCRKVFDGAVVDKP